jgi:cytochrome c
MARSHLHGGPSVRRRLAALGAGLLLPLTAAAAGDPVRGQAVFESRCMGCHSVNADRVGPRLGGVLGRPAGSVRGFEYSEALQARRFRWERASLDRWLADPEALVPGQMMGYALSDPQARADVVAWLATQKAGPR